MKELPPTWKYAIKAPEAPRVCVAIATHDMNPAAFTVSLANMMAHSVSQLPPEGEIGAVKVQGTYVHQARQQLLEHAIGRHKSHGLTHLLWVDADMKFPKDALMRLLAHNQPVVGVNYCQRGYPFEFVAIKTVGWTHDETSARLFTGKDSTGLEEVEALGFGMVLMRLDIMDCLPSLDDKPWFGFDFIGGRKQVGEDVRFCKFLTDAGHKIYVDHDLSKDMAHIGSYEFECDIAEKLYTPESAARLAAL